MLLLALFQLAFWGLRMAETDRKRFSFGGGDRRKLTGACGAVTGLLVAAVLVISLVSVYPNAQQFYGAVYAGEGMVYRTARQVTGRADEPVANGYISRGNNYRTGTVQLRLTASRQPGETLYLRGFAGGTYGDSHWEAADDRSLFLDISDEMGWGSWGTWLNGVFSSMYFMLNSTAEAEGRAEPVSLNIQHTAGGIRPLYTPYYSRWEYQRDYQQDGASEQAAARLPGYSFQYYEQQDMDVDWTRQTREMEESAEWFRQIQDIYMEEIQTVYTQVPKEEVRSLAALCREHPASDLADATSVILSVLENSTSYTLTPGSAPVNTDIVEYFLFDSREGYCVHYASAATLMYRLYGIPARYGAGYAVQPSDFVLQEDGTWVAEVTDESAHAWTEIFLEDYGWTPVEVTPASDGSMLASYPGFDAAAAVLPQVRVDRLSERGRDGEETAEGEPGADENENEDGAGEGLLSGLVSGASERQVWAGCADCGGWSRAGLWSSLPSSWICCISRDTWRGTRGRRRSLAQSWPAR